MLSQPVPADSSPVMRGVALAWVLSGSRPSTTWTVAAADEDEGPAVAVTLAPVVPSPIPALAVTASWWGPTFMFATKVRACPLTDGSGRAEPSRVALPGR